MEAIEGAAYMTTIIILLAAWVVILAALVWWLERRSRRKPQAMPTENGPVITRVVGGYIVTDHKEN